MQMNAAIMSIGDELALGQNLDTNTQWLANRLVELAYEVVEHRTVADDRAAITAAIRELAARSTALIITGGLGPTADDLTRQSLADVLTPGEDLVTDADALATLERWFAGRGREMPAANRVQATRPRTTQLIPNPHGTAPGLTGQWNGCRIFALPGPPHEMRPMFEDSVIPALPRDGDVVLRAAKVNEFGLGESDAAQRLGDMMDRTRHPLVGTTASESIVSARLRARGRPTEIDRLIERDLGEIERCWHPYAFSRGEMRLAEAVGELLAGHGCTVATAESCTGGWLGKRIVDVAGSSAYYRGGWITYADEMKHQCLGVDAALLKSVGAVSAPVAEAMALGAARIAGSEYAVSITGIAGPDGGSVEKPVGTAFIGLAQRQGAQVTCIDLRRFRFSGDRLTVRDRSVKAALQMLRFALLDVRGETPLLWETSIGCETASVAEPRS